MPLLLKYIKVELELTPEGLVEFDNNINITYQIGDYINVNTYVRFTQDYINSEIYRNVTPFEYGFKNDQELQTLEVSY